MVNALDIEAGADAMAAFGPGQVVINLRSGVTVAAFPAGPDTAWDTNERSLGDAGDDDLTKRPERHETISKIRSKPSKATLLRIDRGIVELICNQNASMRSFKSADLNI